MSLFKLPLLLLSSISYHVALDFPPFLDPEDKIIVVTSIRERIWRHAGLPCNIFLKGTTWLATVAESMVIISSLQDTPPSSVTISAVLDALGPVEASKLTVPFVLGASLIIAGGIIRVQCYRALGPYFTFEQCIRKEHKLIMTGPYAVVRHPGYVSLLMCVFGSSIMYGWPGSWLRTSGVLGMWWFRAAAVVWCLIQPPAVVTLFRRSTDEDRFLAERFGKEWENWARRVKYKLVPFVY